MIFNDVCNARQELLLWSGLKINKKAIWCSHKSHTNIVLFVTYWSADYHFNLQHSQLGNTVRDFPPVVIFIVPFCILNNGQQERSFSCNLISLWPTKCMVYLTIGLLINYVGQPIKNGSIMYYLQRFSWAFLINYS